MFRGRIKDAVTRTPVRAGRMREGRGDELCHDEVAQRYYRGGVVQEYIDQIAKLDLIGQAMTDMMVELNAALTKLLPYG